MPFSSTQEDNLKKAASNDPNLTSLSLVGYVFNKDEANRLVEALKNNTTIQSLDLSRTNIATHFELLKDIIQGNNCITRINLSHTGLNNQQVRQLASWVGASSSVTEISIEGHMAEEKTITELMQQLSKPKVSKIAPAVPESAKVQEEGDLQTVIKVEPPPVTIIVNSPQTVVPQQVVTAVPKAGAQQGMFKAAPVKQQPSLNQNASPNLIIMPEGNKYINKNINDNSVGPQHLINTGLKDDTLSMFEKIIEIPNPLVGKADETQRLQPVLSTPISPISPNNALHNQESQNIFSHVGQLNENQRLQPVLSTPISLSNAQEKQTPQNQEAQNQNILPALSNALEKKKLADVFSASVQKEVTDDLVIAASQIKLGPQLGEGGFGVVYKGVWSNEQGEEEENVAIKVLRDVTDETTKGFNHEVRIIIRFCRDKVHENLIRLYGLSHIQNSPAMILELAAGDLISMLQKNGKPGGLRDWQSSSERHQILRDIAAALCHLHQNGILHLDLKGGNVLITSAKRAKLTDFGISRAFVSAGQTAISRSFSSSMSSSVGSRPMHISKPTGTATHMSPESWQQIMDDNQGDITKSITLTPKHDIYALSILFWELAQTGAYENPFEGIYTNEIINKVKEGQRPYNYKPQFFPYNKQSHKAPPDGVRDLIEKCGKQDPKDRPNAATVLNESEEIFAAAPKFI